MRKSKEERENNEYIQHIARDMRTWKQISILPLPLELFSKHIIVRNTKKDMRCNQMQ